MLCRLGCVLLALLANVPLPAGEPPDKKLPFAGPPPPPEMEILAPLVGQWTSTSQVRPSLRHKEGFTATGSATGQWLHNRHFIRVEGATEGKLFREEFTVFLGYDARKKVYRRWVFGSTGFSGESEGRWDAEKATLTWTPLDPPPGSKTTLTILIQRDRNVSTIHMQRADGTVTIDLTATLERRPEPKK